MIKNVVTVTLQHLKMLANLIWFCVCFARNFFVRECDSRITIVLFIPLLCGCAKIFKNPPSRFLRSIDCFIQQPPPPPPPPHAFSEDKQPGDNFKGICKVTDRH